MITLRPIRPQVALIALGLILIALFDLYIGDDVQIALTALGSLGVMAGLLIDLDKGE